VLLIEGSSRAALEGLMQEAKRLALLTGTLTSPAGMIYETAFTLTAEDMRAAV
jgi:phage I-like protein